jgi:K+-sensing histidine kinase KdpD
LDGDVRTIFDRFVKLGEKKNSIGLGLPIVKKICEVSGFNVFYKNNEAEHTITIEF